MYTLLNCFPLDSTGLRGRFRLIKKIIKKNSTKRNSPRSKVSPTKSTRSTKSNRSTRSKKSHKGNLLNRPYKSQIDLNEDKNIKLVSYSTINTNDDNKQECANQNYQDNQDKLEDQDLEVAYEVREMVRRISSKANRSLSSILEEDSKHLEVASQVVLEHKETIVVKEEIKIIDIERQLNDNEKVDDKLNEKTNSLDDINGILHELHVNSIILDQVAQPADLHSNHENNQSCTLGTKHDDLNNDEKITSGTVNLQTNSVDSEHLDDSQTNVLINEQMDTAPIDLTKPNKDDRLIDDTNVDELDAEQINTSNKLKQQTKNISNLLANDETNANQTNQTANQAFINNQSVQAPVQQLQTNQTQTQTDTHVTRLNQDAHQPTNTTINATKSTNDLDDIRKINKKMIQDLDLRTNPILNGVETWIELNKGNNSALGIDLIDRKINDEILFIIHEIIEKGIAEIDQRLKVGDLVLQVNDIPLKNMDCEEALDHLNRTNGSVKLLIYRELICVSADQAGNLNENCQNVLNTSNKSNSLKINYSNKSTMQESERDENVEQKVINGRLYEIIKVDLQKKTNKGLGLCIVNDKVGTTPGPHISEILPNSVAYMEGHLKKGDHIVNINGEDVSNQQITGTIAMLKCLPGLVTLKVARLMPGQIVSLESFNRNQHQTVEPIELKFKIVVLDPNLKNEMLINPKRKPINDRLKELQQTATKDTDSVGDVSLMNETVCNDWNADKDTSISTISKNWVKVDKSKPSLDDEILIQQLEGQSIHELDKENKILEIDGKQLNESNRNELIGKLISKLKRSKSVVQLLVLE